LSIKENGLFHFYKMKKIFFDNNDGFGCYNLFFVATRERERESYRKLEKNAIENQLMINQSMINLIFRVHICGLISYMLTSNALTISYYIVSYYIALLYYAIRWTYGSMIDYRAFLLELYFLLDFRRERELV